MMIRATVFNFVRHEISPEILPFAYEYSIIPCIGLESNYAYVRGFLNDTRYLLDKMANTPNWSIFDRVYIIFPCETLQMFQVMLLITALSAANIQPSLWMETSESRGTFVDVGDFFGEGLDFSMRKHAPTQELPPVISAQVDALAKLMTTIDKEKKNG